MSIITLLHEGKKKQYEVERSPVVHRKFEDC